MFILEKGDFLLSRYYFYWCPNRRCEVRNQGSAVAMFDVICDTNISVIQKSPNCSHTVILHHKRPLFSKTSQTQITRPGQQIIVFLYIVKFNHPLPIFVIVVGYPGDVSPERFLSPNLAKSRLSIMVSLPPSVQNVKTIETDIMD